MFHDVSLLKIKESKERRGETNVYILEMYVCVCVHSQCCDRLVYHDVLELATCINIFMIIESDIALKFYYRISDHVGYVSLGHC